VYSVTSAGAVTLVSSHPVRINIENIISPYTIAFNKHVCAVTGVAGAPLCACACVRASADTCRMSTVLTVLYCTIARLTRLRCVVCGPRCALGCGMTVCVCVSCEYVCV
jgi:hypothetical protein